MYKVYHPFLKILLNKISIIYYIYDYSNEDKILKYQENENVFLKKKSIHPSSCYGWYYIV